MYIFLINSVCAIISGCNGSGKTTIMRAIGLIIIIA